jgi:hypothetical protein
MFKKEWYKQRFTDIKEIYVNYPKKTVCVVLKNGDKGIAKTELGDKFSADYGVLMGLLKAREVKAKNTYQFTMKPFADHSLDSLRYAISPHRSGKTHAIEAVSNMYVNGSGFKISDFVWDGGVAEKLNPVERLRRFLGVHPSAICCHTSTGKHLSNYLVYPLGEIAVWHNDLKYTYNGKAFTTPTRNKELEW